MRTLVIGDIHGYRETLDALLNVVAPRAEDRLITLGDYVDRGPDSRGVLDRLIALQRLGCLIPLLGNHDEMMLFTLQHNPVHHRAWLMFGGLATLASYGLTSDQAQEIPAEHRAFLESCLPWYETETHLFAHALIDPKKPMAEQDTHTLRWEKLDEPILHVSGKTLVCGHTRQDDGWPLNWPGTVCIDTGVYDGPGWLSCLVVEQSEVIQANRQGEIRRGPLHQPPESIAVGRLRLKKRQRWADEGDS
jgi:serine/threonine protein phosphatase 1